MKKLLLQLAAYNLWANKLLLKKLATLPRDIIEKDMGSSFKSINDTLYHIMEADFVWWQRLQLQEMVRLPDEGLKNDFEEMSKEILRLSANWVDLVKESSEIKLDHVFGYHNSKKAYFKQPVKEALMHVFNHQTYHRGQIVTMLRQNNIDKIPATDFIEFTRSSKLS